MTRGMQGCNQIDQNWVKYESKQGGQEASSSGRMKRPARLPHEERRHASVAPLSRWLSKDQTEKPA